MNDDILVSICCICYNHEKYLHDALEGFLNQKTTFKYEIIVHDDVSTDNSCQIIREYQNKYPDVIRLVQEDENQWTQHKDVLKLTYLRARGKYIAICEGDDYWIDEYKLQKQVEFMEQHEEYSACFHRAKKTVDGVVTDIIPRYKCNRDFSGDEILRKWIIPTASFMFRRKYVECIPESDKFIYTDIVTFLTMASYGKLYYCNEVMSVYRQVRTGAILSQKREKSREKYKKTDKHLIEISQCFKNVRKSIIGYLRFKNKIFEIIFLLKNRNQSKR